MSNEYWRAFALANRVLDRNYADPDDDLAVLARQFLRAHERGVKVNLVLSSYFHCSQNHCDCDIAIDSERRLITRDLLQTLQEGGQTEPKP